MTANQISYHNLMETRRSNQAREFETNRSNLANEDIGRRNATSNERNAASNEKNAASKEMDSYTNRMNVKLNEAKAYGTTTLTSDGIKHIPGSIEVEALKAGESARHNKAAESETYRHNVQSEMNEGIKASGALIRGIGSVIPF